MQEEPAAAETGAAHGAAIAAGETGNAMRAGDLPNGDLLIA